MIVSKTACVVLKLMCNVYRDMCLEHWEHSWQSTQYTISLLVLQFALPLSALIATYARIACAVWGGRPPGEAQGDRDTRLQQSKRKVCIEHVAG